MEMNITDLTLVQTIQGLKDKKFSRDELNQAYLSRISQYNENYNIFLTIEKQSNGVPAAIKDIISTKDIQTTAGSKILKGYIPPYNATVVERLLAQGISVIGKTNCDEFAMGSSGENSAYGPTKNPWDITKVTGGSSSGSAAAVAADLCVFSLGTDTGGSIRQPASLCGVVGFKPSYGRCSRYGLIAMASSLDVPGPFTKCVADTRLVLEWMSGTDGYDSNCTSSKFSIFPALPAGRNFQFSNNIKGLKVGIPKEFFGQGLDKGVEQVIKEAIKKLEEIGAKVVEVSLPHTEYAVATYYIIMSSEVSANLARFDGIRFGHTRDHFGPEPKRRIMLGTFVLSRGYYEEYFTKAAKVRQLIKQDFDKAFQKCDVIVGPVSPTVAWNLGEKIDDPLKMYLSDVYTIPASLAGIPGISVPCGYLKGLPVGLQILGRYMEDELVLDLAEAYEQATDWREKKPKL